MLPHYRILYAGSILDTETSLHRYFSLQRLGQEMFNLNLLDYAAGNRLTRAIRHRLQVGPLVRSFNERVLEEADRVEPHIFWADKAVFLMPQTLDALRRRGIFTLDYTIDNCFGPRKDPVWRLYKKSIGYYDLHVLQRDVTLAAYRRAGARHVMKLQTAYDPAIHYPPPAGWSDRDRTREVSFIGSPYDERADFMVRLYRDAHVPVSISGYPRWARALNPEYRHLFDGRFLAGDAYREELWRSKINLSFITHSNEDEFAGKTFEIAGCGAFQIVERSAGHMARFLEDEEIVYFSSFEECVEKIRRYLPDEAARTRIAAAGRRRAVLSGYDNDSQMRKVLAHVTGMLAGGNVVHSPQLQRAS